MQKIIQSEQAMYELGRQVGEKLSGGETLELVGDVGAGKTTLTKAIAAGLSITAQVQSPTFTISNRYDARDNLTLVHYDFYRLHDAGIMQDELAEAVTDTSSIVVVEWGDIVTGVLPDDRTTIRIVPLSATTRMLTITPRSKQMQSIFEEIV